MLLKRLVLIQFLILFCSALLPAQSKFNYNAAWEKVDELVNKKGLTETALKEVKTIYEAAKKEKNNGQLIKALVFRINLQQLKTENAGVKAIQALEQEISTASEPVKSILLNFTAEAYWQFLQDNRWKFYSRTNTSAFVKTDLETWTVDDFHQKISALYLASLQNEKLLQETSLKAFEPIIYKGSMSQLRPTLFDLLANRALAYFEHEERSITQPADAFEINTAAAFDPAADFVHRKFVTKDSLSLHHKALLLYQQLIALHLKDAKQDALIDIDLLRLQFVNRYSTHPEKTTLYQLSLKHLLQQYNNQPIVAQAAYLLAKDYADYAATYDFKKHQSNDANNPRYYYQKAAELCQQFIRQSENSEGKANCTTLLLQIENKDISIISEKVNIPGQPFRSLITYRNLNKAYFRIVQIEKQGFEELQSRNWEDAYWKKLTSLPIVQQFNYNLPATEDHQTHRTEIKVGPLPAGTYMLLASGDADFSLNKNMLAAQFFHVSNIAWMHHGDEFFVVNRETGQPLAKANIILWEQIYNNDQRKNVDTKAATYTSNANGNFRVTNPVNNNAYSRTLEIQYGTDQLHLDDRAYAYVYRGEKEVINEEEERRTFLFTDRSIYRPGQTVFFKGILTTIDAVTGKPKVVEGFTTKIYLNDANGEEIDSLTVNTSAFGSYAGKFVLPMGKLNGSFSINDENTEGSVDFSVEEYKRPQFYVDYQPIKESYRVYDQVKITGNAKAYAGNNIDGAIVKYRVVRTPRLLYPWLRGKWGWPVMQEQEITHGESTTKADGSFEIIFTAIPDQQVRKELEPVFDYKVIADITDLNGETRTGETTVSIAYTSLQLQIRLPQGEMMVADSLKNINILTQNMMGEFVKSKLTVSIHQLDAPTRLIRERYWEEPDQFVLNEKEYLQDFPNDEYKNETDKESWTQLEQVYEKKDSSAANGQWPISNAKFKPGWYIIEVSSIDKDGNTVKNQAYIQLIDGTTKNTITPTYVWKLPSAVNAEPGSSANLSFGSSANDVYLIQIDPKDEQRNLRFYQINHEQKQITIPITEKNRGGFGYSYSFVKHNRFFSFTRYVSVPWSNKELSISYETFRDKTMPGSEEQWKVKISGYKGDQVAAELLTSMYDASLDQFQPHHWNKPALFPIASLSNNWMSGGFTTVNAWKKTWEQKAWGYFNKSYDQLIGIDHYSPVFMRAETSKVEFKSESESKVQAVPLDLNFGITNFRDNRVVKVGYGDIKIRGNTTITADQKIVFIVDGVPTTYEDFNKIAKENILELNVLQPKEASTIYGAAAADGAIIVVTKAGSLKNNNNDIQIRKNFQETAFFFPDLKTDEAGNISFSFTMPEALTKWKWLLLAHTKDLSMGISERSIITQKELMVQSFAPRFLREGDRFEFSAKITNLTNQEIIGQSGLQLFNTSTMQPVDGWFQNTFPVQHFSVAAGQSTVVKFRTDVPYNFNEALTYRIIAKGAPNGGMVKAVSDGEEATIPVLTNRILVTETLPLPMRVDSTKHFVLTKLLNSEQSETLTQHKFTIEFTSNPVWYAVQALPYLIEYPYECAEQTWNRFYANALASQITTKLPRIKAVFEKWKITNAAALQSNLEKNEELKSILLQETPWVLAAKNETQQKKNIALLFDMVRMSAELSKAIAQLQDMQTSNGGFMWFKGGPDDRYITQYIVTGIGHLKKLNAIPKDQEKAINAILAKAILYLDKRLKEDYDYLLKNKMNLKSYHAGTLQIQYLYMRSFYKEMPITAGTKTAYDYYYKQTQQNWIKESRYMQGMIALYLHRNKDAKTSTAIVRSLKENALQNEEMGMYWKEYNAGYYWYQAPVSAQAMMIEVFNEVSNDQVAVADLKTWLLKQKQTQNWSTTIATAEACYALLLTGGKWIETEPSIEIKAGNQIFNNSDAEAGTGYFKQTVEAAFVKPEMGNITVNLSRPKGQPQQPAWGTAYWQYFENLDKITSSETGLQLKKQYFVEQNTTNGPILTPVNEGDVLKVGDKIKVRIELRVDRNLEYVHMKDMRPSCMEPVNVISAYKWQGGLGYYESTKDASTNFFFGWLTKGTYVFEYPLFITHAGNYSSGITTIQCMYAPEFSSHSEGLRLKVGE